MFICAQGIRSIGNHHLGIQWHFFLRQLVVCSGWTVQCRQISIGSIEILTYFTGLFTATSYAQLLNLIFGLCWLFILIAEDITEDLITFNDDVKTAHENRAQLKKSFCDLVHVYSDAKE